MGRLLEIVPKNLLAFLLIVGGIAAIIIFNPPHTICDSQLEVIDQSQHSFLFSDPKLKKIKTTQYERLRDQCKDTNDTGGCYELFQDMKALLHDLGDLPTKCGPAVAGVNVYKRALWETADLMVRLAWGEKPPAAYTQKLGWLDAADMNLFCRLQDKLLLFYGDNQWANFREKMMHDLPGAKDLPRNQVWDLSIFSENCARYR